MPRLFVGNFDFEHHLADFGFQPSAKLRRLNAELAASWLAIAEDGDAVWCPEAFPPAFFDAAIQHGLPRMTALAQWDQAPDHFELVPWGWTDRLIQWVRERNGPRDIPEISIIREVNSRQFSFDLETEWSVGLPGASAVREKAALDAAWQRAAQISNRTVVKANWGMSARERIVIDHEPNAEARAWMQKRIARDGVVFVEPWVQRVEEVGIQLEIPRDGSPRLMGLTALVCDAAGQYQGSWFTDPPDAGADWSERWRPAVEWGLQAAARLQARRYVGPLGIDALRYRLSDGSVQLRPLQDINARWTMGRLSLGWRRLLAPGESGCWRHGSQNDLAAFPSRFWTPARRIVTAPAVVGGRNVHRRSFVFLGKPNRED